MSLAGCQIIQIDLNLILKKCFEIFDTNTADKIQSQNRGVKVPCLMPIRVKDLGRKIRFVKAEKSFGIIYKNLNFHKI
jgi:hypothetical protein